MDSGSMGVALSAGTEPKWTVTNDVTIVRRPEGGHSQVHPVRTGGVVLGSMAALLVASGVPETGTASQTVLSGWWGECARLVALAPHLEAAAAEIEDYRTLVDGWDGIGSVAPDPDLIDSAITLLGLLPPVARTPEPLVAGDGEVGWFWRTKSGLITISFSRPDRYTYYGEAAGMVAAGTHVADGRTLPEDLWHILTLA